MSNNNRRKLLKSIAAGSGAIIAGKSLPETWTRPVVASVVLPAHAATSPATCSPKTIRAASVDCSQGTPTYLENRYYAIRTVAAPCDFEVIESSSAPSNPYIVIEIEVISGAANITLRSYDLAGMEVTGAYGATSQCSTGAGVTDDLPVSAYDETGSEYTVAGTFTASGGFVTMSELTVTPV